MATLTTQKDKVDALKRILNAPSVMEQFKNALNDYSSTFIASVIDLYNTNSKLQQCEQNQVVMAALEAAVYKLPINKALGFAYIVPYYNKTTKVQEPVFQMGYKGYIQLAMRTGQYKTINADKVYEGEISSFDKLTGKLCLNGTPTSDKIVGYFAYIELLNGFNKTFYMTVEQMAAHAKGYSKGVPSEFTEKQLLALAATQKTSNGNVLGWTGNFHAMALKTVLRLLLSRYGYLSVEMQNALSKDLQGESIDANMDDARDEAVSAKPASAVIDFGENAGETVPVENVETSKAEVESEAPGF